MQRHSQLTHGLRLAPRETAVSGVDQTSRCLDALHLQLQRAAGHFQFLACITDIGIRARCFRSHGYLRQVVGFSDRLIVSLRRLDTPL
jgi:hypothetical protein